MPQLHVVRSIEIESSPEQVFDAVADFGSWTTWSPWLCADPDAKVTVSDDPKSVGSTYTWDGDVVGAGEIEHVMLESPTLIKQDLRFLRPFKSTSHVLFELQPVESGTKISWTMDGSLPWFLFWMKGQMETFIGMDYERGLKMLKEYVETGTVLAKTQVVGVIEIPAMTVVGVRKSCRFDEIGPSMTAAFEEVGQKLSEFDVTPTGPCCSIYHKMDVNKRTFDYTNGFPVDDPVPPSLITWHCPSMRALKVEHHGPYDNLGNSWSAAYQVARYKKLKIDKRVDAFELYTNDPAVTAPADLLTEIYVPIK